MTAGLSRYVPFSTCGQMGASPYLFRSGMNAGISFGEDCRPAGYPREQLKQAIANQAAAALFLRRFLHARPVTVRPRLVRGSVRSATEQEWHADGLSPRRLRPTRFTLSSCAESIRPLRLRCDAGISYERSAPKRMRGAELRSLNLQDRARKPGSVVSSIRKVKS